MKRLSAMITTLFNTRKKAIVGFLATLLIILIPCSVYQLVYLPSPRHSLALIEEAARSGDAGTFTTMVDTDALSGQLFDALNTHASARTLEPQPVLQLVVKPLKNDFQANGTAYMLGRITKDTDSATFHAATTALDTRLQNLHFLTPVDGWHYSQSGNFTTIDEDTAQADITMHNEKLNADATFTVTMKRLDRKRWRIVGADNFAAFLDVVDKAYEKKLAAYNKPLQEKIDKVIKINDLDATLIQNRKVNQQTFLRIHYKLLVQDKANDIKACRFIYELKDSATGTVLYHANTVLTLPRTGSRTTQFLMNPLIPSQYNVSQLTDLSKTTSAIRITAIYYVDGTNLSLTDILP